MTAKELYDEFRLWTNKDHAKRLCFVHFKWTYEVMFTVLGQLQARGHLALEEYHNVFKDLTKEYEEYKKEVEDLYNLEK